MLTARLARVMNMVVATIQLTFINGRNLVDGGNGGLWDYWNDKENMLEIFSQ